MVEMSYQELCSDVDEEQKIQNHTGLTMEIDHLSLGVDEEDKQGEAIQKKPKTKKKKATQPIIDGPAMRTRKCFA